MATEHRTMLPQVDWRRIWVRVFWGAAVVVWLVRLAALPFFHYERWLYDWHVYAAGARDLVAGVLYQVPLHSSYPIPVDTFNYPPFAALVVAPLLALPDVVGGTAWVVINLVAVAFTAVAVTRLLHIRDSAFWAGLAFCIFSIQPWAHSALLGNNSAFVLAMVVGFVHLRCEQRNRLAGVLLGAAIAIKLWPATLLLLLVRERQWGAAGWAVGAAAAGLGVPLAWLGADAIGPMVGAINYPVEVKPDDIVLGISWLKENVSWWPSWGGYAIAAAMLLVPARGDALLGLTILAGMAAVPNLWRHYVPTVVVGFAFLLRGLWKRPRSGEVHVGLDDVDVGLGHRSAQGVVEDRDLHPGQLHAAGDQHQDQQEGEQQPHRG